jgi:hypothetical protein
MIVPLLIHPPVRTVSGFSGADAIRSLFILASRSGPTGPAKMLELLEEADDSGLRLEES